MKAWLRGLFTWPGIFSVRPRSNRRPPWVIFPLLLAALLVPTIVCAQQLPTATERRVADVASWGTVLAAIALDTKFTKRDLEMQGLRLGATYGAVWLVKSMVHEQRPCAPDCGNDNPNASFFSGHTAGAFSTLGGPRLAVSLSLGIGTGSLRVAAGKHWPIDVLVGASVGALTSRIR